MIEQPDRGDTQPEGKTAESGEDFDLPGKGGTYSRENLATLVLAEVERTVPAGFPRIELADSTFQDSGVAEGQMYKPGTPLQGGVSEEHIAGPKKSEEAEVRASDARGDASNISPEYRNLVPALQATLREDQFGGYYFDLNAIERSREYDGAWVKGAATVTAEHYDAFGNRTPPVTWMQDARIPDELPIGAAVRGNVWRIDEFGRRQPSGDTFRGTIMSDGHGGKSIRETVDHTFIDNSGRQYRTSLEVIIPLRVREEGKRAPQITEPQDSGF